MMGCAWVQPLMYFVLLNVPMFRGSYMIMKVRHSIRPGDMSTTFTGCRMANMSTKLVEDIFTDDDFLQNNEYYDEETTTDRELKADITNDCEYRIYPLWESNNLDFNGDEYEKASYIMDKLMEQGFEKAAAAGIVGNMRIESRNAKADIYFDPFVTNKSGSLAVGLVQWKDNYYLLQDMMNNHYEHYGHYDGTQGYKYSGKYKGDSSDKVISKLKSENKGLDYQINFLCDSIKKNEHNDFKKIFDLLNKEKNPKTCADLFRKNYEKNDDKIRDREDNAQKYFDSYKKSNTSKSSEPSNKDPNDKRDVNEALFEAINKSAQATPSIGVELKYTPKDNGYFRITQKDNGTSKLGVVFDMVLNSSYYDHIQELGYVYPNGGLENDCPPQVIFVKGAEKVDNTKKNVWITLYKENDVGSKVPKSLPEGNTSLLTSLAKRANKVNNEADFIKEVEQMKDWSVSGEHVLKFLEKYKPEDCESIVSTNGSTGGSGKIEGFSSSVTNEKMKKVLSKVNVLCHAHNYNNQSEWRTIGGAEGEYEKIGDSGCGWCTYGPSTWYHEAGEQYDLHFYPSPGSATHNNTTLGKYGMKMVWHGTIEEALSLPISSFRPGDVSTQYYYLKGKPSAHGCMFTGKDWRSDFIQKTIMSSSSMTNKNNRDGNYSVCIWRHPDFQEPNLQLT